MRVDRLLQNGAEYRDRQPQESLQQKKRETRHADAGPATPGDVLAELTMLIDGANDMLPFRMTGSDARWSSHI